MDPIEESRTEKLRRVEQRIRAGGKDVWLWQIRAKILKYLISQYGDSTAGATFPQPGAGTVRHDAAVPSSATLPPERKTEIRELLEHIHQARR